MNVATTKRDYYEVLGVSKTANGEAEVAFKECAEAYEFLSDDDKRRRYDQFGHSGVQGQHDFSHMDVGDIFSMFDEIFGGLGGRGGGPGGRGGGPAPGR